MRRAIWEIARLHTLATSETSDFYNEKSCNSHVCQTMQAASLTRELCRQHVRTHSLVCRTGAAPHPLMLRGSTDAATPNAGRRIACTTRALSRMQSRDCATKKSSSKVPLQHTTMRQRRCRRHRCVLENSMLECANTTLEGTMAQRCERQRCKMHKLGAAQFSPNTMCFHRSGAHTMSQSGRLVWILCVSVMVHLCRLRRRQFQHNNVVWDSTAAETTFNSLQASVQQCFNPLGSRLLGVHVDKDLQH